MVVDINNCGISGDDHPISENIEDALILSEFVLSRILQQETPNEQDSNAGPGNEAITSYDVSFGIHCIVNSILLDDPGVVECA